MVALLRHLSFRIWFTVLSGGLASLFLMPAAAKITGLSRIVYPAIASWILVFMATGWVWNRLGRWLVARKIREAAIWERGGQRSGAEAAFRKCAALHDSFLVSPMAQRRSAGRITACMARFYLAGADVHPDRAAVITAHLRGHPDDRELAESWLRHLAEQRAGSRTHLDLDLCHRIGKAQPENMNVQRPLARICLADGRTDFPALTAYRKVLSGRGKAAEAVFGKLSGLFLLEGRADFWALQVYLSALKLNRQRGELLKGIAASVHHIAETGENRRTLAIARKLLGDIPPEELAAMREGFTAPILSLPPDKPNFSGKIAGGAARGMDWMISWGRRGISGVGLAASGLFRFLTTLCRRFLSAGRSERGRRLLKFGVGVTVSALLVLMVASTVSHLLSSGGQQRQSKAIFEAKIIDRFTVQVAAYLKPRHAKRFVAKLRAKEVDARWSEVRTAEKRWYQVRVSHFPTKEDARAYGEGLRSSGIIDDFYVANHENGG